MLDVTGDAGSEDSWNGQRLTVTTDLRDGNPVLELVAVGDSATDMPGMRLILVDGVAYTDAPLEQVRSQGPASPEGQPAYLELSSTELDEFVPGLLSGDTPLTFVETLWDRWDVNAKSVALVGTEERDGLSLDHYVVTLGADTPHGEDGDAFFMGWTRADSYDVWLDEEGLMRRVESAAEGMEMVATLDGWGERADIEAPDPATVMTLQDWQQSMLGEYGDGAYGEPGPMPIEISATDRASAECSVNGARVTAGQHLILAVTEGSDAVVTVLDDDGEVLLLHEERPYSEESVTLAEGVYRVTCTYPGGVEAEEDFAVSAEQPSEPDEGAALGIDTVTWPDDLEGARSLFAEMPKELAGMSLQPDPGFAGPTSGVVYGQGSAGITAYAMGPEADLQDPATNLAVMFGMGMTCVEGSYDGTAPPSQWGGGPDIPQGRAPGPADGLWWFSCDVDDEASEPSAGHAIGWVSGELAWLVTTPDEGTTEVTVEALTAALP